MEQLPQPKFKLEIPGSDTVVDYRVYGEFKNVGTFDYEYIIKDKAGLAKAVGQGIFPHEYDYSQDSYYQNMKSKGLLEGNPWDHIYTDNPQADFFIWASTDNIERGVRQFFIGEIFQYAGLISQAVKAFYAALVHYPRSICWSNDNRSFFWFVGQAAIVKISHLCRQYPELGVRLEGADFNIGGHREFPLRNLDLGKEKIEIIPGFFTPWGRNERVKEEKDLNSMEITKTVGTGKVQLVQFSNRHWQLRVDGKPFFIKGMTYAPTRVGETPFPETLAKFPNAIPKANWMWQDTNNNGKIDAPYESWVDKNRNRVQDEDEPVVGDFKLLKDMGCNCLRFYHEPEHNKYNYAYLNKPLLRDMYVRYGIRVALGDFLGAYCLGSGADPANGTDYTDPAQCARMKKIVEDMVLDNRDEPYILLWVLGNENNMPAVNSINAVRTNAYANPAAYLNFVNEVAKMIHQLDPNHPVVTCNNDVVHLNHLRDLAPDIDIFGVNAYKGSAGFGELWQQVYRIYDKPILVTEYGCDCYHPGQGVNEGEQAIYHEASWKDILYNRAGRGGYGNSIGGIVFEWLDEWWKSNRETSPFEHDTTHNDLFILPDGTVSEEWFGLCGQGDGKQSPFLRELRRAYYLYKTMWTEWPLWEPKK